MRQWRTLVRRLRDDEGSSLILVIGLGMLALALVLIVTAATSMAIERRALFTIADGAALAASEHYRPEFGDGMPGRSADAAAMWQAAEEWVQTAAPAGDVALIDVSASDAEGVAVTLQTYWEAPVLGFGIRTGIIIEVTADSRGIFAE